MYTNNFNLTMMVDYQINKELVFNEAINKLDWYLNRAVEAITDIIPLTATEGTTYIYNTINFPNKEANSSEDSLPNGAIVSKLACYINGKWRYSIPKSGMIVYVKQIKNFVMLDNENNWKPILILTNDCDNTQANQNLNYISARGAVKITSDLSMVYLNDNILIDFAECKFNQISIVIKQNDSQEYNVTFSQRVLWPEQINGLNLACNSINIIQLIRLPDQLWLGKVENYNYQ